MTVDLDRLAPRSVTVARCVAFGVKHRAGLDDTMELIGLALVALAKADNERVARMFAGQVAGLAKRIASR